MKRSHKSLLHELFIETLKNCMRYELQGKKLQLLNEIGTLRGLSYARKKIGDFYPTPAFLRYMKLQNQLLANSIESFESSHKGD